MQINPLIITLAYNGEVYNRLFTDLRFYSQPVESCGLLGLQG